MLDFQTQVNRNMPSGSQQTYLIGYIHKGIIDSVKVKNLSMNTGLSCGVDLDFITKQVASHLSVDTGLKILSITPLGIQ